MTRDSSLPFPIRSTQNFLKSARLVDLLLERSSIGSNDVVVEIDPGKGRITRRLAARCRSLVAIELDGALVTFLRGRLTEMPNVVLYHGNALDFPLPAGPYKVFSNIPFNITASLVSKLMEASNPPEDSYLIVQREAAYRILGRPSETLFALTIKPWFEPSVLYQFSPDDFDPAPRVAVVMLRLRKRGPPLIPAHQAKSFRDFVSWGFSDDRALDVIFRQVMGKLQGRRLLAHMGIETKQRPSTIQFEQWLALFRQFVERADSKSLQPAAR